MNYAKEKLQLPARKGTLHNIGGLVDTVEDPGYVTVVGLMLLDMLLLPALPQVILWSILQGANTRSLLKSVLGKLKSLKALNKNI